MGVDTALLLVGFGVMKLTIAAAILWFGFRSGERPDDGDDFGDGRRDDAPRRPPTRPMRRRAPARHGPARSPSRRGRRVRA